MQSTVWFLFIALAASKCHAKFKVVQGNDISIEFDKLLKITFSNDRTSDVEFRHQQSVVACCLGKHGCKINDERFIITQNTSAGRNEYVLTSKDIIQPDLCGAYECKDLLFPERDSAQVSIIGFNNDTYNATEEKDTIYLTTACIFNVSLSDMKIVWYTFDNTTLRLLDENEMEASLTLFNNASVCSDYCDTLSAYKFTFGLNITDEEQGSTDVFIETKIFHPDYMNKPLTWRSSNTFRVKESSPKTPTSGVLMTVIVLVSVCVTVSTGFVIYAVIIFRRKRSTKDSTLEKTTPWLQTIELRFRSRGKKAATTGHVETQPDDFRESDRDSQCILRGETPFHLPNSCIHSQSDEDIPLCVEVLRDDTEIDSDIDLVYITNKDYLRDSGIDSQSDEDIPLCVEEIVLRDDTEIRQTFALIDCIKT